MAGMGGSRTEAIRVALREAARLDREWMRSPAGHDDPRSTPWMPFPMWDFIALMAEALPESGGDTFLEVGCVDADSEYLSPSGWRRIADYDGGTVMQYDPETGEGSLVQPERYLVKECTEFYDLHTKYGISQRLSAEHRVLFWKVTGTDRRLVPTVWTAEKFAAEHGRRVNGVKGLFQTTFTPQLASKIGLSDAEIRVQVMVNADGYLRRPWNAVLKFKKPRKIQRARELLAAAGISYHEGRDNDSTRRFSFMPPWHTKSFAGFWKASAGQLAVVADECLHWDGSVEGARAGRFYTRDREAADFIQYAVTASGYRAVLREDHDEDGSVDYRVFANRNTMIGMEGRPKTDIMTVPSEDGKAYCFTVPTGFWVMRRDGNVVMTGNCGIGTRMLIAREVFGLDVHGIDRVEEYVTQAWKLGCAAEVADALGWDGYGKYPLIWFNRPFSDPARERQLEAQVWNDMARGAVVIAANLESPPPLDWWPVLDDHEVRRWIAQKS
jgi:hypothetical protein